MFADADQVSGVIVQRAMDDLAAHDLAVAKYRASHGIEQKTRFAGNCARLFAILKILSGVKIRHSMFFVERDWHGMQFLAA